MNSRNDLSWYEVGVVKRYMNNDISEKYDTELFQSFILQVEFDLANGSSFDAEAYARFPLDMILTYLQKGHEYYLDKKIPEIEQTISSLINHAEMDIVLNFYLQHFFTRYRNELNEHIDFEEKTIFSYITYLLQLNKDIDKSVLKLYLMGSDSLSDFVLTHADTEGDINKVLNVLKGYSDKFKGFSPYHLLIRQLKTLEMDLSIHAKLEDQVLVPRAIQLENRILRDCFN